MLANRQPISGRSGSTDKDGHYGGPQRTSPPLPAFGIFGGESSLRCAIDGLSWIL